MPLESKKNESNPLRGSTPSLSSAAVSARLTWGDEGKGPLVSSEGPRGADRQVRVTAQPGAAGRPFGIPRSPRASGSTSPGQDRPVGGQGRSRGDGADAFEPGNAPRLGAGHLGAVAERPAEVLAPAAHGAVVKEAEAVEHPGRHRQHGPVTRHREWRGMGFGGPGDLTREERAGPVCRQAVSPPGGHRPWANPDARQRTGVGVVDAPVDNGAVVQYGCFVDGSRRHPAYRSVESPDAQPTGSAEAVLGSALEVQQLAPQYGPVGVHHQRRVVAGCHTNNS